MVKSKKGAKDDGASKFDGFGVDFKCKLIGITDVPAARGDDICQSAMTKLKMVALQKNKESKEHKQKITVNITLKGIRILDESTERIDHAHPIHRISFISHDNDDKRTFAYIVGTKEGYKLFAIKAMKEAELITSTLKELFQEVFERYEAKKREESGESPEQGVEEKPVADTPTQAQAPVSDENPPQAGTGDILNVGSTDQTYAVPADSFADWRQLNERIEVMQSDSFKQSTSFDLLADVAFSSNVTTSNDPFGTTANNDPFASTAAPSNAQDDFNPFGDINTSVVDPAKQETQNDLDFFASPPVPSRPVGNVENNASADLYSVVNKSNKPDTESDTPLLMNDPFAELKKNINELHKQNQIQQQQQPQFGYFPPQQAPMGGNAGGFQGNPFASQNPYQQPVVPARPVVAANPFQTSASASTPQDEFGWTVTKPTPSAARIAPSPVVAAKTNGSDPFAFLDNQTTATGGNSSASNGMMSNTANASSTSASGDILDFLG